MAKLLISANTPAPVEYAISPAGRVKPVPVALNKSGALYYHRDNSGEIRTDALGNRIVLCKDSWAVQGWRSVQSELSPELYDEFLKFQKRCAEYRRRQKPADWPEINAETGLPPHLIPNLVKERLGLEESAPQVKKQAGSARVVDPVSGAITAVKPPGKKPKSRGKDGGGADKP